MLASIIPVVFWGVVVTLYTKYKTEDSKKAFYAWLGYMIVVISIATLFLW